MEEETNDQIFWDEDEQDPKNLIFQFGPYDVSLRIWNSNKQLICQFVGCRRTKFIDVFTIFIFNILVYS